MMISDLQRPMGSDLSDPDFAQDRTFERDVTIPTSWLESRRTHWLESTTTSWRSATVDSSAAPSQTAQSEVSDAITTQTSIVSSVTFATGSTTTSQTSLSTANSRFDIVVNYSGDATYKAAFTEAAARWEEIITADLPDVTTSPYGFIDDLVIDASITTIDGVGGILGQAGPDSFRDVTDLPSHGIMQFDTADVATMYANGTWTDVILHEMGHVLGIGILWDTAYLDLIDASGDYIGSHGLAEYRKLSHDPTATSVPIEHDGGSGTAGAHWDEQTFDNELMTGYIESAGTKMPISRMTIGALQDMGYSVDYSAADPYTLPGQSPLASKDFNGDGLSGILWQNADGQAAIWDMNGTNIILSGFVGPNPGTSWKAIDTGDFDGDGKSGILWQNASGQAAIWDLDGTRLVDAGTVGSNPGTSWKAIGTGDFDGDGHSDILWQSINGQAGIWELDGTRIVEAGLVGSNPGTSWKAIGTGDFDGDGHSDILWQNTNGQVGIWELDGPNVNKMAVVGSNPGTSWKVIGTGDFNDDGKSDILWQHTSGQVSIWELDGTNVVKMATVGSNPGTSWTAKDTGDYNGDGRSDILWQHTSGQASIWELDGTNVIGGAGSLVANVDSGWHVV
jgi:hypothetical protein